MTHEHLIGKNFITPILVRTNNWKIRRKPSRHETQNKTQILGETTEIHTFLFPYHDAL